MLQEGEVVLIKEQDTPRGTWIMGRIEETIVGGNGNVRSAKVRLTRSSLDLSTFYIHWNYQWNTTILPKAGPECHDFCATSQELLM